MEEIIIEDAGSANISLDRITIYSCRPPELRFVPNVSIFWCCFTRNWCKRPPQDSHLTTSEIHLHHNLYLCAWLDGLEYRILVKPKGIVKILELPECTGETRRLFELLNYICYGVIPPTNHHMNHTMHDLQLLKKRFVDLDFGLNTHLPLPVYTLVKPKQATRFLIHILLSMGSFSNEGELFSGATPTKWFRNAKLLPGQNDDPVTEEDILNLTKKVILEQLLFMPNGTRSFDNACVSAYQAFRTAFLGDSDVNVINLQAPTYLHTQLEEEATPECEKFIKETRDSLTNVLCQLPGAPTKDLLMAATMEQPIQEYAHQSVRIEGQSLVSYTEATTVLHTCKNNIDKFCNQAQGSAKNLIITGGPGCGKTFQMQLAALYARTKGLNCAVTAFMSERAQALGGVHLHNLFCLPGQIYGTPQQMADKAIRKLKLCPVKWNFIKTLHMLFMDEFGNVPAIIIAVLDIIFRYVRNNSAYMGGVWVLCTLDIKQIPPIKSQPALISTLVITNFQMVVLKHSVRTMDDPLAIRATEISRTLDPTEDDLLEFESIIVHNCIHVTSWDDAVIGTDVIRVLGKRVAVLEAEKHFYSQLRRSGTIIHTRMAENVQTVPSAHGTWKAAEEQVVKKLDRMVNEVNELCLYPCMLVEFTHNWVDHYSNSQMGLLVDLPQQQTLDRWQSYEVFAAPHGVKCLPPNVNPDDKAALERHGWKSVMVGPAPEMTQYLYGGISAKRKQYGIRHRLAMTIHRAMGSDFGKIASCVSSQDGRGYNLWMKEQVVVLISRTHYLKDLIFVGESPQATAKALSTLLRTCSPYARLMEHIVNTMTGCTNEPVLRPLQHLPYNVHNQIVPRDENGYVYCIMSQATYMDTYIGTTGNLIKRINKHNSAAGGAKFTRLNSLKPWVCIGFVVGFPDKSTTRLQFEREWQRLKVHRGNQRLNPIQVITLGKELVEAWNLPHGYNLLFIQCIEHRTQVVS